MQTKFPGVSKRLLSLSVILFFSQAEKQKIIIIGKLHATTCIITELDYLQRRSTVCESAWELAFSFAFWVNPVTGSCLTQHKIDYRVIRYLVIFVHTLKVPHERESNSLRKVGTDVAWCIFRQCQGETKWQWKTGPKRWVKVRIFELIYHTPGKNFLTFVELFL